MEIDARFLWALQALAAVPSEQLALFPKFVLIGDELALSFDEFFRPLRDGSPFTAHQRERILRVDALLDEMTARRDMDLWKEEAIVAHDSWERLRELARDALTSLRLPRELPPFGLGATYIGR